MRRDCSFAVKSEEVKGKGFPAKQFFDRIRKERDEEPVEKTELPEFVRDLIERLDKTVQKSRVYGQSEHTVIVIGIDIAKMQLGYLSTSCSHKRATRRFREGRIHIPINNHHTYINGSTIVSKFLISN